MRALLVGACPASGSTQLAEALAADVDLLIAVDGGAQTCLEAGLTPDVLLGDFDSVSSATLDVLTAQGSQIITFPAEKDETDLELAFAEAARRGVGDVTLTAVSGGRIDHQLGVIAVLRANAELAVRIVEPGFEAWLLSDAGTRIIVVEGKERLLSLLALTPIADVSASGVRWPLDHRELTDRETRGVSNVVVAATAEVHVHRGSVLVVSTASPV